MTSLLPSAFVLHSWRCCCAGPNSLPLPSCLIASLDTNSDVDLADFAAFQRAFAATP